MLKIKKLCAEMGITQKELAQALDVTERTISSAGKGNASIQMLQRIASALGVKVAELFEDQPEPSAHCPHCGKPIDLVPKE